MTVFGNLKCHACGQYYNPIHRHTCLPLGMAYCEKHDKAYPLLYGSKCPTCDTEELLQDFKEKVLPEIRAKMADGLVAYFSKLVTCTYKCGCKAYGTEPWLFCAEHGEGIV